jgi:hypothetical protein
MKVYDRHLEGMILRQRGQNRELVAEILEKISDKGKERLFRILQDMEHERDNLQRKAKMPWLTGRF